MKSVMRYGPRLVALAAAALAAALYVFTALPRIFYPYDLDFIEDSMLMQSWQFARGLPVYVAPNAAFMPHQYMPLYSWLGGLLFQFTAPDFAPLRLLSFAAVIATAALIFYIARRESNTLWLAIACAGLYLAGFRLTGQWYELVRVDSLFVALSLGGLALAIYSEGRTTALVASAVVLALAFWTKQTALLYGVGMALLLFIRYRRAVLWFLIPYLVLVAVPFWILNTTTGGWFWFHTVTISGSDPVELSRILNFIVGEVFGVMAGVTLLALACAILLVRGDRSPVKWLRDQPWLFAISLGVLISAIGRASVGGNLNNLMSAYTLLCLSPALLFKQQTAARLPQFLTRSRVEILLVAVLLLQFALGAYNPLRYIPTPAMRAAGDALIQRIRSTDGSVFVMMHPYYALRAGKEPSTQMLTLWYTYALGGLPLPADFVQRLNTKSYSTIISDETMFETDPVVRALLDANYQLTETLTVSDAPPTITGVVIRPLSVYRPKP